MANAAISAGAAIGAGTVVTKDVPPFALVVGNPGRVLRLRFPERIVEKLLEIAWWDWEHARLGTALHDIRQLSAEAFCEKYGDC